MGIRVNEEDQRNIKSNYIKHGILSTVNNCVINYGAGNVLFGKIVHRSFQRELNIKKNILSVNLLT